MSVDAYFEQAQHNEEVAAALSSGYDPNSLQRAVTYPSYRSSQRMNAYLWHAEAGKVPKSHA